MGIFKGIVESTDVFKHSPDNRNWCITFGILNHHDKRITGWLTAKQFEQLEKLGISVGSYCTIEFENYKDFKVIFNANL